MGKTIFKNQANDIKMSFIDICLARNHPKGTRGKTQVDSQSYTSGTITHPVSLPYLTKYWIICKHIVY